MNIMTIMIEEVLKIITDNITANNFEQLSNDSYGEDHTFESYGEFVENNKKWLSRLDDDDLEFLLELKNKMDNNLIKLVDEECAFSHHLAKYFYYNKFGSLVLTGANNYLRSEKTDLEQMFDRKFELLFKQGLAISISGPFCDWDASNFDIEGKTVVVSHPR